MSPIIMIHTYSLARSNYHHPICTSCSLLHPNAAHIMLLQPVARLCQSMSATSVDWSVSSSQCSNGPISFLTSNHNHVRCFAMLMVPISLLVELLRWVSSDLMRITKRPLPTYSSDVLLDRAAEDLPEHFRTGGFLENAERKA